MEFFYFRGFRGAVGAGVNLTANHARCRVIGELGDFQKLAQKSSQCTHERVTGKLSAQLSRASVGCTCYKMLQKCHRCSKRGARWWLGQHRSGCQRILAPGAASVTRGVSVRSTRENVRSSSSSSSSRNARTNAHRVSRVPTCCCCFQSSKAPTSAVKG